MDRGWLITKRLLNHEFLVVKLKSLLQTFDHALVYRYGVYVSQMIMEMFCLW